MMPVQLAGYGPSEFPEPRFRVRFPGWDDVIHWGPNAATTPAELDARRRQIFGDLRASPTPQVVADFARIGMEIDNVQDALVTLSVAGRVATRLAGRAIPGVGWVATAADVLNALNYFYPPNALGVGRMLATKANKRGTAELSRLSGGTYRQRLEATVKTGKVGFGWGEALQVLQTTDQLFGYGVSLGPVFGAASDTLFGIARGGEFEFPGFDEAMFGARGTSALRAVDEYFGIPVSGILPIALVAPMGYMLSALGVQSESFTSAEFAANRLAVSWPGVIPILETATGLEAGTLEREIAVTLGPVLGPAKAGIAAVLYSFGVASGWATKAAIEFGRGMAWLGGYRDVLPWQYHVDLAVGEVLMLQLLKPAMQASEWGEIAGSRSARPWWGGALPLVPDAGELVVGEVSARLRGGGAAEPMVWLKDVPGDVRRDWVAAVVTSGVDEMFDAMEGPSVGVEADSGVWWRSGLVVQEVDMLFPYQRTDAEVGRYLGAVASMVEGAGGAFPSRADCGRVFSSVWPKVSTAAR